MTQSANHAQLNAAVPMAPNEALHTAARRFLIDRLVENSALRDEIRHWGVQEDELLLGPRAALLEAMLAAVEAIVPAEKEDDGFRSRVAEAGRTAEDKFTASSAWKQRGLWEATRGERDKFADAVLSRSAWDISGAEPLPPRRTVFAEERAALWARLQARWKVGGNYWLPWSDARLDAEVMVVDAAALDRFVGAQALRDILGGHGVSRVFELWEHGEERDYELPVERIMVGGGWGEQFWFSEEMDWIIYTTHEGSAALAGNWLLAAAKVQWPSWAEHPYVPFRPEPLMPKPRVESRSPSEIRGQLELLAASAAGRLDRIAVLLDAGVDVNGRAPTSGTVLHTAAVRGQVKSVRLLIERGANVDARTGTGVTPLMAAVSSGHVESARRSLAAGADVNARAGASERDKRAGLTPLEIALGSPYLISLGDDRRDAIVALLQGAGAREER